jgi:cytochrome c oxidase subunit 4
MDKTTHQDPAVAHEQGEVHAHPTWSTYWKIAVILTVITAIEVWVYYTPFQYSRFFNLSLVIMSAIKFAIVVMYYMHLKYDHKLFRSLFVGPLILAGVTLVALMFLFGRVKLGA